MAHPELDGINRGIFAELRIAKDLILGFASTAVGEQLDMSTLKLVAARHVSEGMKQSENDLIWEVGTRDGGLLYVYVMLEFQSRRDWTMPLRMANYVGQFYRGLLARQEVRELQRLPQVLPMVIYSGKAPWSVPEDINDMIDRTLPGLVPYGMQMRYLLVDTWRSPGLDRSLRNVADSVLRIQRAESPAVAGAELRLLDEWLAGEEWANLRRVLVRWIMKVLPLAGRQSGSTLSEGAGLRELRDALEGDMRTVMDNIREAGAAEGLAEGLAKGLAKGRAESTKAFLNMVRHKFGEGTADQVAPVLETPRAQQELDRVGVLLLTCNSGEELLAKVRGL